jgi:hypothetical protein
MSKLVKAAPEWHAQAVGVIRSQFNEISDAFMSAARRATWLGLFLNYVKEKGKADKSIPHSQFGPWLEQNLPDISRRAISRYMTIGRDMAEKAKVQIGKNCHFDQMANPNYLPEKVEKLLEGKNQTELFLEARQAEEIADEVCNTRKRGRRKGEGGNSAEHLAAIKAAEEKARLDNLTVEARERRQWLLDFCGPESLGKIPDAEAAKFIDVMETAWAFCRDLRNARKKKS